MSSRNIKKLLPNNGKSSIAPCNINNIEIIYWNYKLISVKYMLYNLVFVHKLFCNYLPQAECDKILIQLYNKIAKIT